MEKKMVINCATCDTRKVQEETLAAYESITINAAMVVTNEASRTLLNKYPVVMNCAGMLDLDEDAQLSTVNGSAQIKSSDVPAGKRFLMVNGSLEIGPDTQQVLQQYVGISVNGSVLYPESMGSCLGMMKVNGTASSYPDGAVVLKRSARIDRTFVLRAKEKLYWSAKRMIMVDEKLDAAALAAKGASFSSKEVIIAESKVEALIDSIDEKAEIMIVPDGTSVVLDDMKLDRAAVKRCGTKLYIIGDVTVTADCADVLDVLEYLVIRGDVRITADLKEKLLETAQEITGEVKLVRDCKTICDNAFAKVTRWLLEQEEKGLLVKDCGTVWIDADVPKELIAQRLILEDCGVVSCAPDQEAVVSAVSEGVGFIKTGEQAGIGGMLKDVLNHKVVNASEYVL